MKECPTCGKTIADAKKGAESLVAIDITTASTNESGERDTVRLVQTLAIAITGKPMAEADAISLAATLDATPWSLDPNEEIPVPE